MVERQVVEVRGKIMQGPKVVGLGNEPMEDDGERGTLHEQQARALEGADGSLRKKKKKGE